MDRVVAGTDPVWRMARLARDGAWRSLVARGIWGAEDAGSNPAAPTSTAGPLVAGPHPGLVPRRPATNQAVSFQRSHRDPTLPHSARSGDTSRRRVRQRPAPHR